MPIDIDTYESLASPTSSLASILKYLISESGNISHALSATQVILNGTLVMFIVTI